MIEKLMTLLVGILLALAGWTLTRTFELSTKQAVLLNQVDQLEFSVQMLEEKMNKMMDSDEEIMEQQRGRMRGVATRGNKIAFGQFALQAQDCGWVTSRQIEASRRAMTRYVKRGQGRPNYGEKSEGFFHFMCTII